MLVKTILNNIEKFKTFVYGKTYWEMIDREKSLVVELAPRKNSRGVCMTCGKQCGAYDTQPVRDYEYVPLWGIKVFFRYAPRRIQCKEHGIHVEQLPWADGKEWMTKSYQLFLARWGKDYRGKK